MSSRRRSPRYAARSVTVDIKERAFLRLFGRTTVRAGTVLDIAEGGIRLISSEAPTKSSTVDLAIRILGDSEPLKVSGLVAWVSPSKGGKLFQVGVRFEDQDGRIRDRLARLAQEGRLVEIFEEEPKAEDVQEPEPK